MTKEKPLHVSVENKSSDVHCPKCNEKATKHVYPGKPMSIQGQAFCDNADCSVHEEQKLISWSYENLVDQWAQEIPAACEGEVFRNSPPDKEPDGEGES